MEYTFIKHCRETMRERKIEEKHVETVIARGQKWFSHADSRWHARMGGIKAVYEVEGNECIVITCFYTGLP